MYKKKSTYRDNFIPSSLFVIYLVIVLLLSLTLVILLLYSMVWSRLMIDINFGVEKHNQIIHITFYHPSKCFPTFVLDLRGNKEEEKSSANEKNNQMEYRRERVTDKTRYLKGNDAVRLEYFGPLGIRAYARIDKERARESYQANYNTSDRVYT